MIDRCTSSTIDRCRDARCATWFQPTLNPRCMSNSTRSNKDKHLLFSEDPAHLERTIRKDQRSTSLDAAAFTSTDSRTQPSTDIRPSSSTDLHRSILHRDGHLRNATGQKLYAQRNLIPDTDAIGAAQLVEEAARPRALADHVASLSGITFSVYCRSAPACTTYTND
ncbi:hypothetical protein F2Q70_00004022 [Brassica cretica]|uniref:Uncharacterized protein n=1 Tax=Brassica cretica TaxID=69181 RepID=A0A8S9J4U8_BRACR|nr:hypothetical protein F2Q70_00004022 [Brassica cretica]